MSISIANNALENCQSLEQVVELINEETATDASAEMIAAKYALDAAIESGYDSDSDIAGQLEFLSDEGAKFDYKEALAMALNEKKN